MRRQRRLRRLGRSYCTWRVCGLRCSSSNRAPLYSIPSACPPPALPLQFFSEKRKAKAHALVKKYVERKDQLGA